MESTFDIDYDGLKRLSKEFVEAAKIVDTYAQLDNAWKCLGIAYLDCRYTDDELGRINRVAGAPYLMRIMSREYLKAEIRLADKYAEETRATELLEQENG